MVAQIEVGEDQSMEAAAITTRTAPGHPIRYETARQLQTLSERVRGYRLAAGLSAAEVARRTGIATGYYSEIERGRKTPSTRVLKRLAEALGCSLAELLEGPDPLPAPAGSESRREVLIRLLETSARLDTETLRSLLDYAGYLAQARTVLRRSRNAAAEAPLSAPLFPDSGVTMAPLGRPV